MATPERCTTSRARDHATWTDWRRACQCRDISATTSSNCLRGFWVCVGLHATVWCWRFTQFWMERGVRTRKGKTEKLKFVLTWMPKMIFLLMGLFWLQERRRKAKIEEIGDLTCADDLLQDDFNLWLSLMLVPSTVDCRSVVCNFPEFYLRWESLMARVACKRVFMRLGSQVSFK